MTNCHKCKAKIRTHLWIVEGVIYCSPRCERGKYHRFNDKAVEKLGVAGLKGKEK